MKQAEVFRALQNLIRVGTVSDADYGSARVRVAIGDLVTGWLPWMTSRAGDAVDWWAPSVGEQVIVLSPGGDLAQGFVLHSLYQASKKSAETDPKVRKVTYPDGTVIEYDATAKDLKVTTSGTINVISTGDINVKAPSVTVDAANSHFTGNVTVDKLLTFKGGLSGSNVNGTGGAAATIDGDVDVSNGDILVDGISSKLHTHIGDSGGQTSEPQ